MSLIQRSFQRKTLLAAVALWVVVVALDGSPALAAAAEPDVSPEQRASAASAKSATATSPTAIDSPPTPVTKTAPVPVTPAPAALPTPTGRGAEALHFKIDPVFDGVLVGAGGAFAGLLGLVLSTGEIKPTLPGDKNNLLAIDRLAVDQRIDPHAKRNSDVGLYAMVAYAVIDPIVSGVRAGRDALLVDALLYAEAIALTQAFTNMTKIAVRRSRPVDYLRCSNEPAGECTTNTDLQLSFFSGHASLAGAVTGTASYLAFVRHPYGLRPWLTLGLGTLLTGFISYERVRAGQHFPTDVIMGAIAGASISVLVCHVHRRRAEVPLLIGIAPLGRHGAAALTITGRF